MGITPITTQEYYQEYIKQYKIKTKDFEPMLAPISQQLIIDIEKVVCKYKPKSYLTVESSVNAYDVMYKIPYSYFVLRYYLGEKHKYIVIRVDYMKTTINTSIYLYPILPTEPNFKLKIRNNPKASQRILDFINESLLSLLYEGKFI